MEDPFAVPVNVYGPGKAWLGSVYVTVKVIEYDVPEDFGHTPNRRNSLVCPGFIVTDTGCTDDTPVDDVAFICDIEIVYPKASESLTTISPFDAHAAEAGWNPVIPVTPEKDRKDDGENIPMLYRTTATMTIIKMAQP